MLFHRCACLCVCVCETKSNFTCHWGLAPFALIHFHTSSLWSLRVCLFVLVCVSVCARTHFQLHIDRRSPSGLGCPCCWHLRQFYTRCHGDTLEPYQGKPDSPCGSVLFDILNKKRDWTVCTQYPNLDPSSLDLQNKRSSFMETLQHFCGGY